MKEDFCTLYLVPLFLCDTCSAILSVCVFFSCHLLVQISSSSFLRFSKFFICTVLSIWSLIAVTVAAIFFFNNSAHEDAVMISDAIVS